MLQDSFQMSCGICWNSYIAFSGCTTFAYVVSFLFHVKMCNATLLPPMVGFVAPQARLLPASAYVWNPGTLQLTTTKNPDQAKQPYNLQISGINAIRRIHIAGLGVRVNYCMTHMLHQWENFVTTYCIWLLLPAYYQYPVSAKTLKRVLQQLRLWQDSNHERPQDWHWTRAMAPLTC